MDRTTIRNLAGGFLGGTLGILAAWYLNPAFMPVGVFLGVIVGWWGSQVLAVIRNALGQAKKSTGDFLQSAGIVVSYIGKVVGLPPIVVGALKWVLVNVALRAIVAIINVPGRFRGWLTAHPSNPAELIEKTMHLLGALVIAIGVGVLAAHTLPPDRPGNQWGTGFGVGFLTMFVVVVAGVIEVEGYSETYRFYRQWEISSRYGYGVLTLYFAGRWLRTIAGLLLFCMVAVPWVGAILLAVIVGFIPTMFTLSLIEGLYELAKKPGHWLCLGVTLVVTSVSWLLLHDTFTNVTVWFVALFTGAIAGALTEVGRHFLLAFFSETNVGKLLAQVDTMEGIMGRGDDESGYLGVLGVRIGGFWFRHNTIARLFRSLCFGFPLARTVEA